MSLDRYLEMLAEENRNSEATKLAYASMSDKELLKVAGLNKEALVEKAVNFAKSLPGLISGKAKQVASTYQAAANPLKGAAGPLLPGQTRGVGAGLKAVATQHPGVTAGTVGAAGLGAGYALAPSSQKTAAIFEAGDRAGRVLAKAAAAGSIPLEELQESIEEAKAREDPISRARKAMIAGSIGAGTIGGASGSIAGYGIGRALKLPRAASAAIGGALGAAGSGYAGSRFGKEYGEREALADKTISALRAARAAQLGYGAGLQTGYNAAGGEVSG